MKHIHVFHHESYHDALNPQSGRGLPVFKGYRQRGGGLGGILGFFARHALSVISKYLLPHAKSTALSIASDVMKNKALKTTLKKNGLELLQKVGKDLLANSEQKGSGIKRKKPSSIKTAHCSLNVRS